MSEAGLYPTISRVPGRKSTISRVISRQILENISRQILSCFKHEHGGSNHTTHNHPPYIGALHIKCIYAFYEIIMHLIYKLGALFV